METPADWPFEDPPNAAVITTRGIMDGTEWIALVSIDEEGGEWQFIGPSGARMEEAVVVALHRVFDQDPGIAELADLPMGWRAWREGPDLPWKRGQTHD